MERDSGDRREQLERELIAAAEDFNLMIYEDKVTFLHCLTLRDQVRVLDMDENVWTVKKRFVNGQVLVHNEDKTDVWSKNKRVRAFNPIINEDTISE